LLLLAGCAPRATESRSAAPGSARAAVAHADIARAQNQRAERLERLWARAAVQMRYTDRDGRRRSEQGEGHLQIIQPTRLALSVGKVGEVLFWLGSDERRFWWFELGENSRAGVALHENAQAPCIGEAALPVHPLDLLDLLGVTPIPATSDRAPLVDATGRVVIDATARGGARRIYFDPDTLRPVRVELWRSGEREPAVVSDLSEHERVDLPSEPGVDPRAASRVRIAHRESDSEIILFLSDMSDGSRFGRLSPAAFEFATLVDSLAPMRVDVLDEACARSARAAGSP
jgi:hypothetical protein